MQETVRSTNERKSLFSSFLEVLESREKQAQVDRQLQEEKYLRRTQRIYDFHERQVLSAAELRRCVELVGQRAGALEAALRGGEVALGASLARQAAALQRCMAQCVANAARIRHLLADSHQPQMDTVLARMESELSAWNAFLQRAVDATCNTEVVIDNLHNMIAEQRRCVREVAASSVFTALCGGGAGDAPAAGLPSSLASPSTPPERPASKVACSTPLARD